MFILIKLAPSLGSIGSFEAYSIHHARKTNVKSAETKNIINKGRIIIIMDRAKGYSLAFGLFSVIIVLFIYMYAKAQQGIGWAILKWACIVYLVITLGGFLIFLAILIIIAIVLFGLFIIAKMRLRKGKKEKPEKRDKKAIDTEYEIKD